MYTSSPGAFSLPNQTKVRGKCLRLGKVERLDVQTQPRRQHSPHEEIHRPLLGL